MSNGRTWTPKETATLERMAGRVPDARIAELTGHCERTIRDRRNDAGLPAYAPRPKWTRRDWLLAGAAGVPSRRGFLAGMGAFLAAPVIVRASTLMPISPAVNYSSVRELFAYDPVGETAS